MTTTTADTDQKPLKRKNELRRFRLQRLEDESGVSGTGYVAEGVQFSDGTCVLHWDSVTTCTAIYHSHVELIHIHGHEGKTVIEWVDPEFPEDEETATKTKKKKRSGTKKPLDKN